MKVVPFGEWDAAQKLAAMRALIAHGKRMASHPFVVPNSPGIVWGRLKRGELRAALMDGYLLVYDVGAPWSSKQELLYEFLLTRALPGGTFNDAIEGMRYIAKVNGCIGVISGNGVLRPGLSRLYERAGAVKHCEAYFIGV